MDKPSFSAPDLDAFCLLDTLALTVTGQAVDIDQAVLECRTNSESPDSWCRDCGAEGTPRGTAVRRLVHVPLGWRPTILHVRVRRYRCPTCKRVWREDLSQVAASRAKLSRPAVLWALKCLVIDRMSISRIAAGLGAAWHTVNTAMLATGQQLLIDDPARFDGVRVLGVDEHVWRHTPFGSKYATVIIDLTPIRDKTGPSRLLDIVEGRSKKVFKTWLANRSQAFRRGVEDIAMDGFAGYKSAAAEELPDAVPVMDPFHVVALASGAVERCRQRIQQETLGHRGRSGDPLYGIRRVLLTGANLLTPKQVDRLEAVLAAEEHTQVDVTWWVYQRVVAAYRDLDRARGRARMQAVITGLSARVPAALAELTTLGRTLKRRAADVLAYFDRPGTSNGPTEAINGRLEHLRGTALGFRNLGHYLLRSLLDTGGFRPLLHSLLR
ncbi:ISL3 family transposase [Brevibacterium sp. XM4083]|uniref:ISL3 family transposase n=1 Tax=Brevibacterium sp. XM4083 TaxID=2583238 RepID=UPI001125BDF0|nr:ISL3 family transposase [Brevibacterium sp. XM4083]MCM1014347.1 ISL3 family transposase [Brevibacterium sp. XM4083]